MMQKRSTRALSIVTWRSTLVKSGRAWCGQLFLTTTQDAASTKAI